MALVNGPHAGRGGLRDAYERRPPGVFHTLLAVGLLVSRTQAGILLE